ncbi:MAG: HEAT repeat domain-containing protein [Elusimicrobiota bacterium]|nr:HEAT repeat domain-containing protein [Elusimicrobiota bacterium]MDH5661804.1 HEAT repeat domain-containing protein [Elusimicrobiota bacterium]
MRKLYIYFIILILFLSSCYPAPRKRVPLPVPEYYVDEKTEKAIRKDLTEVEEICQNNESLDVVGKSTMTQSARLIDLGKVASPVLVSVVQDKNKNWKFRYWACDLLGYIEDERNILPLIAVIEDSAEEEKIRFCALQAIEEMANPEAVEYLEVAEEIVENATLREEITNVIIKLGIRE